MVSEKDRSVPPLLGDVPVQIVFNAATVPVLGLSAAQVPIFSVSGSMPASPTSHSTFRFDAAPQAASIRATSTRPSAAILLLSKENASHTAASLIEAVMVQLCLQGVLGKLIYQSVLGCVGKVC